MGCFECFHGAFNQDLTPWKQNLNCDASTMFLNHNRYPDIRSLDDYLTARKPYDNLGILADVLEL